MISVYKQFQFNLKAEFNSISFVDNFHVTLDLTNNGFRANVIQLRDNLNYTIATEFLSKSTIYHSPIGIVLDANCASAQIILAMVTKVQQFKEKNFIFLFLVSENEMV